jgi:hypothetical protein
VKNVMTKDGHQVILTAHLDKLAGNTNEGSKPYVCLIFKQNKFNIGDAAFYSSIDTEMLKILVYG